MKEFKVGDKVRIIEEIVKLKNYGNPPDWYTNDIYTISKVLNELDDNKNPIIQIKEELPLGHGNKITSYYLEIAIKEQRKLKLEKLNSLKNV